MSARRGHGGAGYHHRAPRRGHGGGKPRRRADTAHRCQLDRQVAVKDSTQPLAHWPTLDPLATTCIAHGELDSVRAIAMRDRNSAANDLPRGYAAPNTLAATQSFA